MLGFIFKIMAGEFIKRNYTNVKNGLKHSYKYIYKRLYTSKKEKNYFIAVPASRSRSRSCSW